MPVSDEAKLVVGQVPIEVTGSLRWAILRPAGEPTSIEWSDIVGPDAVTFAVFADDDPSPVSTATVFPEQCPWRPDATSPWRLRGMATAEGWRDRGAGRVALDAAIARVTLAGADLLWCNARSRAVPFYERAGFEAHAEEFDVDGIGPHLAMARPITSASRHGPGTT